MTSATEERQVVLLCLDGSPAAETALPVARTVAEQLGLRVEILEVVQAASEDRSQSRARADALRVRRQAGNIATTILAASAEDGVALVVLTTHGRAVTQAHGLGSVAEAVIAGSRRPLLLVRPEAAAAQQVPIAPFHRLLVPIDATPTMALLQPVLDLAGCMGASLDLLYVDTHEGASAVEAGAVRGPRYVDQPQHEWRHWGGELLHQVRSVVPAWPSGLAVGTYYAHGSAAEQITRLSSELGSDAIVLVRRSGLEHGRARVLRRVVQQARCPVLLVGG